ncbi:hypothetical protein AB0N14_30040 [Streptomyces sp. NPDC051104]|uniref:hypothetical protein n=1 Tax=Streptomyces sp. NPDC051104 TaxID=3155044 RepID=UPI003445E37C
MDELRSRRRLAVVTTLHDLTTAAQYADRLVLLDKGRVAAGGTPAEVITEGVVARVYAARVSVTTGTEGRPVVTPLRGPGVVGLRRGSTHAEANRNRSA